MAYVLAYTGDEQASDPHSLEDLIDGG